MMVLSFVRAVRSFVKVLRECLPYGTLRHWECLPYGTLRHRVRSLRSGLTFSRKAVMIVITTGT